MSDYPYVDAAIRIADKMMTDFPHLGAAITLANKTKSYDPVARALLEKVNEASKELYAYLKLRDNEMLEALSSEDFTTKMKAIFELNDRELRMLPPEEARQKALERLNPLQKWDQRNK